MMKLSLLGVLRNGINYDKSSVTNGCKIIGVADFGNRVFPDYTSLTEIDASIVAEDDILHDGDILFVRSNGNKRLVGRTMYICNVREPVCYSGFCIALRPNANLVYPEYLFYALRSPFCKKQYSYSQQSNITNLSQGILEDVDIPIPDYQTQKKLAKIMADIDRKIAVNSNICSELEDAAKTIYDYWFTQFDFPDADGKPYRSSGGEMKWNEQLKRKIPQGWSSDVIGNILEKVPNTVRIQTGDYLSKGNIPIIDQSADFIAGYTNDPSSVLSSPSGYVVFGDHTRIVKYARFPFARGADGTQILKSRTPCVPDELLYQIVRSVDLSNYGYARHFKFLKDTPTIIPTESVAKEFAKIVTPIYDKHAHLIFENIELTKLRDWLLPMLMNGQATVADAEDEPAKVIPFASKNDTDQRFTAWLQNQGVAARGDVDMQTMREIFDAMDDDDK